MDIEEFYDQNPARRTSEEFEFGRDWSDGRRQPRRDQLVHDTGELYLMTAPFEPIVASGLPGDEHVPRLPTNKVVVEVLGVYPSVRGGSRSSWLVARLDGGPGERPVGARTGSRHPGAAGGAGAVERRRATSFPAPTRRAEELSGTPSEATRCTSGLGLTIGSGTVAPPEARRANTSRRRVVPVDRVR